jgi:hypothetical protein
MYVKNCLTVSALLGGIYSNAPNGAVSIANRGILWDFEINELHSKVAIFFNEVNCSLSSAFEEYPPAAVTLGTNG